MMIDDLRSEGLPVEKTNSQWGSQFCGPTFWFCPSEGGLTKKEHASLRDAGFTYGFHNIKGKIVRGWIK